MSGLLKHVFASVTADSATATEIQPQRDWNDYHVFSGGNQGSLLLRDTSDATYGGSWLASVAVGQVLVSSGAAALPAWSANPTLTSLALGTNPAAAGPLRLPNNSYITARNQANGADVNLFKLNTSNEIDVGAAVMNFASATMNSAGLTINGAGTILGSASGTIAAGASGYLGLNTRAYLTSPSDGILTLNNNAITGFTRLNFGGTTSSFPALTRNGAVLETKLADDSAYTTHAALLFKVTTAIVAAGGGAAPTVTTIGGSGPATAAQNGWLKFTDSGGAACYVPVWK